jgi:hypothetical protein
VKAVDRQVSKWSTGSTQINETLSEINRVRGGAVG